jgi:hypothetical protein
MIVMPAAGEVMLLTAAGMRRYCQLEGYDHTASCRGCYVPDSCRDKRVLPAGRIMWHCQLQGMLCSSQLQG